jgi:post-segregation antitoxin (ccd killing protein)
LTHDQVRRKAVNLTMDVELLARAKAEVINLSAELEQGIRALDMLITG